MPDILIRGLDARTVQGLKKRARANGRSLQGEAKKVLEEASWASPAEIEAMFERWGRVFAGKKLASSVDLIREDRDR
jgi:plasmid stability protein